jgi:hypothetical protein
MIRCIFLEMDFVFLSGKMQFGSKYFSKLKYSVGRYVLTLSKLKDRV